MNNERREAQLSQVCPPPLNQPIGTNVRAAQCQSGCGHRFSSVVVRSNSALGVQIVSCPGSTRDQKQGEFRSKALRSGA
jgi:hypothetical protein